MRTREPENTENTKDQCGYTDVQLYPKMELYRLSETKADFVHRLYAGNRDDEEKSLQAKTFSKRIPNQ